MLGIQLTVLAILLILSGFFSGSETALMSISGLKVRHLVEQKKRGAETLQKLKQKPHRLIVTLLVGNNIVNIGASALATIVATNIFGSAGVGIAIGIMTFAVLIFGEITPKTIALRYASGISLAIAPIFLFLTYLLFPLVFILEGFTKILMLPFGKDKGQELSEDELKTIVSVGKEEGILDEKMAAMMHNVLDFKSTRADEIMTPASKVLIIDGKKRINEIVDFVNKTPHSRYPIYVDNMDNIIGYLHVDDVLRVVSKHRTKTKVFKLAKPIHIVPESKQIGNLLVDFDKNKVQIAIVVDEYKNVIGIVTLEDILEEIVGEIFEHKTSEKMRRKGKVICVDAEISISDINKELDLELEAKQFTTVAGLMAYKLGRIPRRGDKVIIGSTILTTMKADKKGVTSVRIEKK